MRGRQGWEAAGLKSNQNTGKRIGELEYEAAGPPTQSISRARAGPRQQDRL